MSKILAVFGATGQQGGSVVNYVLNDPELSQEYKIRAITRDTTSKKARQLKEKIEVIQGDALDRASLETALAGAHTIFAMTTNPFGPDGFETEYSIGKQIADVAVEKGAEYIIFSTLPPANEISGGKYTKVMPFDAKAKIEQYIRNLNIKSAFFSPGGFMQNFHGRTGLFPKQAGDGTWAITRHNAPRTPVPLIDAVGNTGNFVGAILAEPGKYEGKTFCAATAWYAWEEVAIILSKTTGKTVVYKQISSEEFGKSLPFPVEIAEVFKEAYSYAEEFGYWGPDSQKLVAWAVENARGKLTTLEEYFEAHPLQLE